MYLARHRILERAFVKKPGDLRPLPQRLLELDIVWFVRTQQYLQLARLRLLTNRLRVQEGGKDRLLDLSTMQRSHLTLDLSRFRQLSFEDARPALPLPFVLLRLRHVASFARRLG